MHSITPPEGMITSPFFDDKTRWIMENELAFAFDNSFPLTPGHVLIIPKRIILSPFDMTEGETAACMALMHEIKTRLDAAYAPDGYNIGWNIGKAAGQTVAHAHLHIIPRHEGDHPNPRSGICKNLLPNAPDYYK